MLQWRIKIKGTRKRHMMAVHLEIEADAHHAWHNVQLPEKFMGHNSCKTKHTSKHIIAYYYHGQRKCNQNCLTHIISFLLSLLYVVPSWFQTAVLVWALYHFWRQVIAVQNCTLVLVRGVLRYNLQFVFDLSIVVPVPTAGQLTVWRFAIPLYSSFSP